MGWLDVLLFPLLASQVVIIRSKKHVSSLLFTNRRLSETL